MIRFFRTLRKRLLSENRLGSYLIYALGEIILVVIGILIALQINGWNEERILKDKEVQYLKEIRANLLNDQLEIERVVAFNTTKIADLDSSIAAFLNAASDLDFAFGFAARFQNLTEFDRFTHNRIAFDNLLSSESIDLISHDSLRIELSEYYAETDLNSDTQERVKEITRDFVDYAGVKMVNRETISQMLGFNNQLPAIAELGFLSDQKIFHQLFTMKLATASQNVFVMGYDKRIESLLKRIDEYLAAAE